MNRNLWGVEHFEDLTIRHTRLAPDRWLQQAQPALRAYAEGSAAKLIEGVALAKEAKLADDNEAAIEFLRTRNFSARATQSILDIAEREEGKPPRTVWDFAQAITAHARHIPNTDDRLSVELEARKILDRVVH